MTINRETIREELRFMLRAWDEYDQINYASGYSASDTSIVVDNGDLFKKNDIIEIGSEVLRVTAVSTNTLTVRRGYMGSTAATIADNAVVWRRTHGWTDFELNTLINAEVNKLKPDIYYEATDSTSEETNSTRRYEIPSGIDDLVAIYFNYTSDDDDTTERWVLIKDWYEENGYVFFGFTPSTGLPIKFVGKKWQAELTADDTTWNLHDKAKDAVVHLAAACAIASYCARRSRYTKYATVMNERASNVDELMRTAYFFRQEGEKLKSEVPRPCAGVTYLRKYRR